MPAVAALRSQPRRNSARSTRLSMYLIELATPAVNPLRLAATAAQRQRGRYSRSNGLPLETIPTSVEMTLALSDESRAEALRYVS